MVILYLMGEIRLMKKIFTKYSGSDNSDVIGHIAMGGGAGDIQYEDYYLLSFYKLNVGLLRYTTRR
jgi:hypothetical protein